MRQELGAQPGTLHVHGTAVKNVEGAAGYAQGRQGSILRITLRGRVLYGCCLKCCLLLACLLRICLLGGGGGRRLSRHRRQSQQRRQTQQRSQTQRQGSTNSFSVRPARRLKERGHHYPI